MKKQDMRILAKKIANPNKYISIFSLIIVIIGIIGVCIFINPKGRIPRACPWMNE